MWPSRAGNNIYAPLMTFRKFCNDLQIPLVELLDWYREFCNLPKAHSAHGSPHSSPTKPFNKEGKYQKQHNPGPSSTPKHSNASRVLHIEADHDWQGQSLVHSSTHSFFHWLKLHVTGEPQRMGFLIATAPIIHGSTCHTRTPDGLFGTTLICPCLAFSWTDMSRLIYTQIVDGH